MSARLSSAARFPMSGTPPAPSPLVTSFPICKVLIASGMLLIACVKPKITRNTGGQNASRGNNVVHGRGGSAGQGHGEQGGGGPGRGWEVEERKRTENVSDGRKVTVASSADWAHHQQVYLHVSAWPKIYTQIRTWLAPQARSKHRDCHNVSFPYLVVFARHNGKKRIIHISHVPGTAVTILTRYATASPAEIRDRAGLPTHLGIGVEAPKLHPGYGLLSHTHDGITAAASHAHHLTTSRGGGGGWRLHG